MKPHPPTEICLLLSLAVGACTKTDSTGTAPRVSAEQARMTDQEFWSLVALLDWTRAGDDDAVVAPLVAALATLSVDNIQAFEDLLAEKLFSLDGEVFARNIGDAAFVAKDAFFSVDNFLYVRCLVVAKGAEYFSAVLRDPRTMPKDQEFEALLSVAGDAYLMKTGGEFTYTPKTNYETFSNTEGWR